MRAFFLLVALIGATAVSAQVTLQERTVLHPDDSAPGDGFGLALDADGDRLVVGAPGAGGTGAVYVFERQGGDWIQTARLTWTEPHPDDRFGFSVALDGDRLAVGAPGVDGAFSDTGAAFVFERQGGSWVQIQRLDPETGSAFNYGWDVALNGEHALVMGGDGCAAHQAPTWIARTIEAECFNDFGGSVAIGGGRAFVGTSGNLDIPGSVAALREQDGTWVREQTLSENPDPDGDDDYGLRVALRGTEALVGGYFGTVFSYTYGERWIDRAVLPAPAGSPGAFGLALDLGEGVAVVGAPELNVGDVGRAHVYGRAGNGWTRIADLVASDGVPGLQPGTGVAVAGTEAFVGAPQQALFDWVPAAGGPGAVYVYDLTPALGPLLAFEVLGQAFGTVGVGETAVRDVVVANPGVAALTISGATTDPADPAYAVEALPPPIASGETGVVRVRYQPSEVGSNDVDLVLISDAPGSPMHLPLAGSAVAGPIPAEPLLLPGAALASGTAAMDVAGPTAVVGLAEDEGTGVVEVFEQTPDGWAQVARLAPADPTPGQRFGADVALRGEHLLVGAPGNGAVPGGKVYVFERSAGVWTEAATIPDPDGAAHGRFGASLAWLGDDALVGAPSGGQPAGRSALYVFEGEGEAWPLRARIDPPEDSRVGSRVDARDGVIVSTGYYSAVVFEQAGGEWFGVRLPPPGQGEGEELFGNDAVVGEDVIVVGAPSSPSLGGAPPGEDLSGGVYIFARDGGGWALQERIEALESDEEDWFGWTLVDADDVVFVGAPLRDVAGVDVGAVYALVRQGETWAAPQRLTAPDGVTGQEFGRSLGIGTSTLLVGPPRRTEPAHVAYAFDISALGVPTDPAAPASAALRLDAAYPNPFNPSTQIRYALPEAGPVELAVYDVLGRRVRLLVDERQDAGPHAVTLDAHGLASGLYVYRLSAAGQVRSRTVVLVK